MGPDDAARAAEFVGTRKVLGIHYDTFPPIKIDHDLAKATFRERDLELVLAGIGETVEM